MMVNADDNAELRARVMASLKKFEKQSENANPAAASFPANAPTRASTPEDGQLEGSAEIRIHERKKKSKAPSMNVPFGYNMSPYGQPVMSNAYNQQHYFPQYSQYPSSYVNQANQNGYGIPPMMIGNAPNYMMPQQSYLSTIPHDGYGMPSPYQQYYSQRSLYPLQKRPSWRKKTKAIQLINSKNNVDATNDDSSASTNSSSSESDEEHIKRAMKRKPYTDSRTSKYKFKANSDSNNPLPHIESIDLTEEDSVKCKPECSLTQDLPSTHIIQAIPMSKELLSSSEPHLKESGNSIRAKLIFDEYDKQKNYLLEAQDNYQKIFSSIKINRLKLEENTEIINSHARKIQRLSEELQREQQQYEQCSVENMRISHEIEELTSQLSNAERLINSLNENVAKKKVILSQLRTQEMKNVSEEDTGNIQESPLDENLPISTVGTNISSPEDNKHESVLVDSSSTLNPFISRAKSNLISKISDSKSDYHQKLKDAYHKVLQNKLALLKKRQNHLSPFSLNLFIDHLQKMFAKESRKQSSFQLEASHSTCDLLIQNENSTYFSFSSIFGIGDASESNAIIVKDDDFSLEEYCVELIYYWYLLNDSNIESITNELRSIATKDSQFSVVAATEKFTKLLIEIEFHPHIFKEKPTVDFYPYSFSNPPFSSDIISTYAINIVPRFFSSRVVSYLSEIRNIDNSALLEDNNEFEQIVNHDPSNAEAWVNYALAVLPPTMTFSNIRSFEKTSFEKCLSIFSRALEARTKCDELWICYLDLFCYHSDYDLDELNDMFGHAMEYFSSPATIGLIYISAVNDINAKISLTKKLLQSCKEKLDIEYTARAIFCLFRLYHQANFIDCCESLIYGLFFNDYLDFDLLLQYDDSFFSLPESFEHKSFVNSFFIQSPLASEIKILLWLCAIHFLLYKTFPDNLFLDYPYEHFVDLKFKFAIKLDTTQLSTEKEQILKSCEFALEYLLQEDESNQLLILTLNRLNQTTNAEHDRETFILNQAIPTSQVDYYNQEYAKFIKHYIPTYETGNANFSSINRLVQRSLGNFSDFDKIATCLPLQKSDFLAWINYFVFLVKNKTSPKDMEKYFEDSLGSIEGPSKVFIWREYLIWSILTQNFDRIQKILERFVESVCESREIHPDFVLSWKFDSVKATLSYVIQHIGFGIDFVKKDQIARSLPAEFLPAEFFFQLNTTVAVQSFLSRIIENPTNPFILQTLHRLFIHLNESEVITSDDVDKNWNYIVHALIESNSVLPNAIPHYSETISLHQSGKLAETSNHEFIPSSYEEEMNDVHNYSEEENEDESE